MTKEEAKLVLDNARPQTKEIDRQFYDDEDLNNALDMAIKSLEQQSSDDCVSLGVYKQVMWERDIAIEQLKELGYEFGEKIRTSDDCVSRQAVLDLATTIQTDDYSGNNIIDVVEVDDIKSLSPVTPTFPKGATNGDMIKAMFPNQTIGCAIPITDRNGAKFYRTTINGVTDFTEDWWNALYKRGNENGSN